MKKLVALPMKEKQPQVNGKITDFLPALYIVFKKLGQFFFHTLLANLFKQSYISSVTSYKYLNNLISEL